jgi:hypothetical protein
MDARRLELDWPAMRSKGPIATLLACLLCGSAAAQADPPDAAAGPPGGDVGLDSLLKLPPNSAAPEQARTGGATRSEWEARFATARGDVTAASTALDKAQQELGKLAAGGEAWQMSAPGLGGAQSGGETGPISFKLRQEIRTQREELARAQKRLSELEVEAKLAGVPDDWIDPGAPPPKPAQDALAR